MRVKLPLLVMLMLAAISPVASEDRLKDFYEKNFAAAPQVGGKDLAGDQVRKQPVEKGAPRRNDAAKEPRSVPASLQSTKPLPEDGARMRVELYVNSLNREHFEKAVKTLLDIANTKPVDIPYVYHAGDYRNVTPAVSEELGKKGISLIPISSIPKELEIVESPAWVFSTSEGYYILEGTFAAGRFISEEGGYTEPKPPTPQPTLSIKPF